MEADGNTPLAENAVRGWPVLRGTRGRFRPQRHGQRRCGCEQRRAPRAFSAAPISAPSTRSAGTSSSLRRHRRRLGRGHGRGREDSRAARVPRPRPVRRAATATASTRCPPTCTNHDLSSSLDEKQVVNTYLRSASDQNLRCRRPPIAAMAATTRRTTPNGSPTRLHADHPGRREAQCDLHRSVGFGNTFNRLTHRDELYFAMFQPASTSHWPGKRVKRCYKLGTVNASTGHSRLAGTAGRGQPDRHLPSDGSTKSFWTLGDADGPDTTKGGFASRLDDRSQRSARSRATPGPMSPSRPMQTSSARATPFAHAGDAQWRPAPRSRTSILRWARGVDTGNTLNILGDSLHSKPVVVSYGGTER